MFGLFFTVRPLMPPLALLPIVNPAAIGLATAAAETSVAAPAVAGPAAAANAAGLKLGSAASVSPPPGPRLT